MNHRGDVSIGLTMQVADGVMIPRLKLPEGVAPPSEATVILGFGPRVATGHALNPYAYPQTSSVLAPNAMTVRPPRAVNENRRAAS